jgi:hypothetical protein
LVGIAERKGGTEEPAANDMYFEHRDHLLARENDLVLVSGYWASGRRGATPGLAAGTSRRRRGLTRST